MRRVEHDRSTGTAKVLPSEGRCAPRSSSLASSLTSRSGIQPPARVKNAHMLALAHMLPQLLGDGVGDVLIERCSDRQDKRDRSVIPRRAPGSRSFG